MSIAEESLNSKILFVDDEENILSSLKRGFLFSPFEVLTANNPKQALELLAQERIDVVISDFRMPEMDGMQFLKSVKEKFPSVVRIIISGYIDRNILIRSLTNGWASTFFTKPWDNKTLEKKILRILKSKREIKEDVFTIINNAYDLPTCSMEYNKLFPLMEKKQVTAELVTIIRADPVLSIKVLHIANSIFLGEREVISVKEALELLHPSILNEIFISTKHVRDLKWPEINIKILKDIYINSILIQKYALQLYNYKFGQPDIKNLPTLGIIHDIGKIVQLVYFPNQFSKALAYSSEHPEKSFTRCEAELDFKDATHAIIGRFFLDLLNLPDSILKTISIMHSQDAYNCAEEKWACVLNLLEDMIVQLRRQRHENVQIALEFKKWELPADCIGEIEKMIPKLLADMDEVEKAYA
jgi:response regulator RpfG family c-di-GMP phosphodiesterase